LENAFNLGDVEEMSPVPNLIRFVDLFCGIGGFHLAAQVAAGDLGIKALCVFASDIDPDCRDSYEANFGIKPAGDITEIPEKSIPDHDFLFAGFPCQSFSICGDRKGFEDARGTLFFDIARILKEKRPTAFLLENVKQLGSHDHGRTLRHIMRILESLGYHSQHRVLNALHFGLPQKRERIFIVGFREPRFFNWPRGIGPMKSLCQVLESEVPEFYYASHQIRENRLKKITGRVTGEMPTIWHENKGGHISAYPYSCALRAGASYNYLLVNGERRLTEREMLRLQGFPDSYKIVHGYSATRKQAGNSVAVPCVTAVIAAMIHSLEQEVDQMRAQTQYVQGFFDYCHPSPKNETDQKVAYI